MIDNYSKRLKLIPNSIWLSIAQIDELKGQWIGGANINPYVLNRLQRSVLVTSTGASTRIEGSEMSDQDIEKMLRGISIQSFKDRDKQEVQGYYELLQNVFDSWQSITFSESTIKHFHKELLKYTDKDSYHRGEYKHTDNKVEMIDEKGHSMGILFDTTPAYLTPKKMRELVEWTEDTTKEKKYHQLLIIANFIVEFLNIHPFSDGNGRLSRILTNLMLLKANYLYIPYVSHEKLIEDNKPEYYLALRKSQKTLGSKQESIVEWLNFFLKIILRQSQIAVDLLSHESIETLLSPNQRRVWDFLQKVDDARPGEISKHTKVARPTVSQAINKLLNLKKIEKVGLGSATRYRKV